MPQLLLTFAVALAAGFLFMKIKIPGGMLVGAIVSVSALNIAFSAAYMPSYAKVASQVAAGAFIGCTVEKSDVARLRHIGKPAAILLCNMLILNLLLGFLVFAVSPLDLITSLMCCVPGGMTDTPIISADMGADPAKVVTAQFIRMLAGLGLFPTMILWVDGRRKARGSAPAAGAAAEIPPAPTGSGAPPPAPKAKPTPGVVLMTLGTATVSGLLGWKAGIPAGTLVFSLIGVLCLKFATGKAGLYPWLKRLAQALAGAYIGSGMTREDLLEMKYLILPAVLIVFGYILNCFITSHMLQRYCGMETKEAMLTATPAGASDMALISSDLGVQSTDLVVLQIIRLVTVVVIFPQIISLVVHLAG